MKSPLRYPGGKTRACAILDPLVEKTIGDREITTLVSPFLGGGSFEFYLYSKHGWNVVANDSFQPLITFWNQARSNQNELCIRLRQMLAIENKQEYFHLCRTRNADDSSDALRQASEFFFLNRTSFSGCTLSGGYSTQAASNRFTESSIARVGNLMLHDFRFTHEDFEPFLQKEAKSNCVVFLDPPYMLDKGSTLYGKNGSKHKNFDHERLHRVVSSLTVPWIMTYNDCEEVRNLYKDFHIETAEWSYGMNKSKESSEIVITSKT